MIENPSHSLTFGDLVWVEDGANPPDSSGVVYRVRAQDASLGVAVPVTTALMWLGRAGGPVSWDNTPNREPVFRVTVEADDSDLLARGEMALQLQAEQPTTLVWTPPDGAGSASVFDIVWSHLEPVYDRDGLTGLGMEETVLRSRTYLVRMQALPHARGEDLVVTPGQATPGSPPVTTVVDNGSALTGSGFAWTATDYPGHIAISVVSGTVRMTVTDVGYGIFRLYRSQSPALSATGYTYLAADVTATAALNSIQLSITSVGIVPLVLSLDLGGGITRHFFQLPAGSTSLRSMEFRLEGTWGGIPGSSYFAVDQLQLFDRLPDLGTGRQKALSLVPKGSVRTSGSVHISASNALGKVIVYTHPSGTGYLPPLRRYRTSGNTVTSDSTLISGAREPIGASSTVFRVPVPVLPIGRVELWAWLRVTSGSLTRAPAYAVRSIVNGVTLASSGGNFSTVFTALNTWQLFNLGALTSPPIGMGPAGLVQIDLNENSGQVDIDEAYLFATDLGNLTVVDCGTGSPSAGGPSKHLWIDAPTPDLPMGAIYRGHSADRSDAFHAAPNADVWGDHAFDPQGTSVFVVTSNATDAATSLEHYRRYGTFVVRED